MTSKKFIKLSKMNRYTLFSLFMLCNILIVNFSCDKERQNSPPLPATLIQPENGNNCTSSVIISQTQSSVSFSWDSDSNTDYYSFNLSNLISGEKFIETNIISNTTTKRISRGFPYEWFVESYSNSFPDDKKVSAKWQFYLPLDENLNSPPFPANLLSPISGSLIRISGNLGIVNLEWLSTDPDGDSLVYTLYIDNIDGKQPPIETHKNLSRTNIDVDVELDKIYYWRVLTIDSENNASYSQISSFRILN